MRMPELKALAREHRLRGYSQLRKAELIQLLQNDQWNTNPPLQSWEPSMGLEGLGLQKCPMPQRALSKPPHPDRPPPPPPGQSHTSVTQTWDPRGSWALRAHGNLEMIGLDLN